MAAAPRCTALELVVDQSGSLDVSSRVLSRFFDLVGHQTPSAYIENKHVIVRLTKIKILIT